MIHFWWIEAIMSEEECYTTASRCNVHKVKQGQSHFWHVKYTLPYTKVVGLFSKCLYLYSTGKLGDVKIPLFGWCSITRTDMVEKQFIIYITAKILSTNILFLVTIISILMMVFECDIVALQEPSITCIFWRWLEDDEKTQVEKPHLYKYDAATEALLL